MVAGKEKVFVYMNLVPFYGRTLVKVNEKEGLTRGMIKILVSDEVFVKKNIDCEMTETV
jgi:hypothetical protein